MTQRITIEDVAKAAGVSTATVSRVLNNSGTVAESTSTKVYAAVQELEYVPHSGARMLAASRTQNLGLIMPGISGLYFTDLLRGIEQVAYDNGYHLLLFKTNGRFTSNSESHLPIGQHNTDGLIIFDDSLSDERILKLYKRNLPLVLLHRLPPKGTDIPSVTFQNKRGARELVEYLLQCGHRRIAFLAGPDGNEDSHCREQGYEEALAAYQIEYDPSLIKIGGFLARDSETAVSEWLAEGTKIDAIFAGDDESARGALTALKNAGLRVPDDIAVVGFDDDILAPYLQPPLTTVRAPIEKAGRIATQQLIQLIETGVAPDLTLLPTKLIIRDSCGGKKEI